MKKVLFLLMVVALLPLYVDAKTKTTTTETTTTTTVETTTVTEALKEEEKHSKGSSSSWIAVVACLTCSLGAFTILKSKKNENEK